MSLTIISTPEVDYSGLPSLPSRYFSVNRPILFGIERGSDYSFSGITTNSPTTATVTAVGFGAAWYNTVTAGEDFQIEITGSTIPDGIYTVISDILITSDSFIIDITGLGLHPNTFTGGNLKIIRLNYRVKTEISVAGVVVGTAVNKLDSSHQTTVDVSAFLKSSIVYNDDFSYTVANEKDLNKSNVFTLRFAEFWNGYDGAYDSEGTGSYYFINSVQQLGAAYSGNMAEYVVFSADSSLKAKFLSDFLKPTYFEGYPFTLDFIFSDEFVTANYDIKRKERAFNINGVQDTFTSVDLDKTQDNYINRMMLAGSYNSTSKYVDVWLERFALI